MIRGHSRISQPVADQEFTCLSWAKIQGTGTVAVIASENVASITDNAGGDYTVTWAVPYATASSYAVVLGSSGDTGATTRHFQAIQTITASAIRTSLLDYNSAAATDPDKLYLIALGEF